MDWTQIYLDTFLPELPKIFNTNFESIKRYLDVFYDEDRGILIKPLETTGNVKGAQGEFVTVVADNLIVKNQWTNLYDNFTTADYDFYKAYTEIAVSPRDPCTYGIDTSIWTFPYEDPSYKVIDVNKPYYKITNANPIFLANRNLSQVVGIIFDSSLIGVNDFEILMDPCEGTIYTIDVSQAGLAYMEFITTDYDSSWGSTWVQYKYGIDEPSAGIYLELTGGTLSGKLIFDNTTGWELDGVTITTIDTSTEGVGQLDTGLATSGAIRKYLDASFGLYETKVNLDTSFGLYETKVNLDSSFGLYETKVNLDSSLALKADLDASINEKITTYILTASDNNNVIDASGTWTLTMPDNLNIGFQFTVVNAGPGIITLDASELLTTDASVKLSDQYAGASGVHKGNGIWYIWGNLS